MWVPGQTRNRALFRRMCPSSVTIPARHSVPWASPTCVLHGKVCEECWGACSGGGWLWSDHCCPGNFLLMQFTLNLDASFYLQTCQWGVRALNLSSLPFSSVLNCWDSEWDQPAVCPCGCHCTLRKWVPLRLSPVFFLNPVPLLFSCTWPPT